MSQTKNLPFEFIWPWLEYFVKINKANTALEGIELTAFCHMIEHGKQIMESMLGNQQLFQHLMRLKLNDNATFWQKFRDDGDKNFEKLVDLLVACERLVVVDLGQSAFDGEQLRRVIQAIRVSPSMRFLQALHLDRNRPDTSVA